MIHDAIVIGGGPAGLAAATWLGRYRRRALLIDGQEQRNRWVERAHGYLGWDPCPPRDLLERARADLDRYDTVVASQGEVEDVTAGEEAFEVVSSAGTWTGRRVVLATGVRDVFPDIEGFFEHYGASVFHCPACDGYDARGRDVVVFGWNAHVAGFALSLFDWASSVTIVTDGRRFEGEGRHRAALARHGIRVAEARAVRLLGSRAALEGVLLDSGADVACSLAFFSITHEPRTHLARRLGCGLDDEGYVAVDHEGRTSVASVYAAGDLTPGTQLIQVAAAKGATAGIACALSLRGERSSALPTAPDVERELGES